MATKATVKPEPQNETDVMEAAEQKIAQMMQEAQHKIDEMNATAEQRLKESAQILETAKLNAASIPASKAKSNAEFNADIREAEKLSMEGRMKRQFGEDDWLDCPIPLDPTGAERSMSVTVNGISYDLERGAIYRMPRKLFKIVMGSRYVESPEVARTKITY